MPLYWFAPGHRSSPPTGPSFHRPWYRSPRRHCAAKVPPLNSASTACGSRAPEVALESLTLDDEKKERFEGRILKHILGLGGKDSAYYYIRTRREPEKIVTLFAKSGFRYLHLSCHGNTSEMATTFDRIRFPDLGRILRPHLYGRLVFLSSCEMATQKLANELILHHSGCHSGIGPSEKVHFADAALLWSSFYHLVFRTNDEVMKRKWVLKHLQSTATLFGVRLNYFSTSKRRVYAQPLWSLGRHNSAARWNAA